MNLPNKITVGRLIGCFIAVLLFIISEESILQYFAVSNIEGAALLLRRISFVVMAIACLSDYADGYFARKYNLITDFGKLMDPLADKIVVMAGFILICVDGFMHPAILITILSREFAVTGLRGLAASKNEIIAASNIGKIKTVLQMVVMGYGGLLWSSIISPEGIWQILWNIQLAIITVFTVYSGFTYFWKARHLYMKDT